MLKLLYRSCLLHW